MPQYTSKRQGRFASLRRKAERAYKKLMHIEPITRDELQALQMYNILTSDSNY